ncbi:unnamed protein product [Larinioides sclopetarius]|uniref:Sulfotransferase n=1 Tax=Larinioides sclopetarius TaxID=280406 RepID=A0AAV1ZM15_9ARAC
MNNGRTEYTFYWFIENYSYCWHKNGARLVSPSFTVDKLEGTTWILVLFPKGSDHEDLRHISVFLDRSEIDEGSKKVSIQYQLSFLAADGSEICSEDFDHVFKLGDGHGCGNFIPCDEVLSRRKSDYLPQGTLTVRCKIWNGEGSVCSTGQSSARTRIRVEKNSFLHILDNFSTLQPNVKQSTKVRFHTERRCFIKSSLYLADKKVMIEIMPSDDSHRILCKCELFLLDGFGNVIECGKMDYRNDVARKSIFTLALSLTKMAILSQKLKYLPDDKLSLICECTFSSGIEFQATEETINEIPLALINQESNCVSKNNFFRAAENLFSYPSTSEDKNVSSMNIYKDSVKLSSYLSIAEDMKTLYINQCLTDVEVKTKTKSFPAHKIVLCVRSPVFKATLTSDMNARSTDCIHIDDLENDVVQQMLLFLYSDSIENLQWENATRLYYAADKYKIGKLREVCSSFLVDKLTPTNAGELLLLADIHNYGDLKKLIEDFILEHEEEVFDSKEWNMVAEKNPLLVIQTMQLKYKRKKMKCCLERGIMNIGRKEYTFFWFIENYSYCWHRHGRKLFSPDFTFDKLLDTTWKLELYPRGIDEEDKGHMFLFLSRSEQDGGPENISIGWNFYSTAENRHFKQEIYSPFIYKISRSNSAKMSRSNSAKMSRSNSAKMSRSNSAKMSRFQMIRGIPFPNVPWFRKENIEKTMDYVAQNGDIVIASYPKTGTHWLQYIVLQITSKGESYPSFNDCIYNKVPFMEMTGPEAIDNMKDLRIYKNHYRYNMVPKNSKSKVLYIYRNPEDTLVSLYHFLQSSLEEQINFDGFFEGFIAGDIEYGSYFKHVSSYLAHKDDDNLLLVSYEKLHANRREETLRIAKFLGEGYYQCLSDDESLLGKILERTSFEYTKKNLFFTLPRNKTSESSTDESEHVINFFRKGTVGDGKKSLSLDQLKRLQKRVVETIKGKEVLREWLDG